MFIEFSESGAGIGLPYERRVHATGINHGYFDLKRAPEKIDDIPELWEYPELYRFIQSANAEESVVRTAGCAVELLQDGSLHWSCTSFVHLLFEILHWNTSGKCYRIFFDEFRTWIDLSEVSSPDTSILFSLGPTSFWHHGFDGRSLRVHIEGRGTNKSIARQNWHAGLTSLATFLKQFSTKHLPQLVNCARRVS